MPQHVTFSDGLPTGAKVEASGRPNWHAFGMLVACSGAGIVILLCYILVSFANAAVRKCGGSRQLAQCTLTSLSSSKGAFQPLSSAFLDPNRAKQYLLERDRAPLPCLSLGSRNSFEAAPLRIYKHACEIPASLHPSLCRLALILFVHLRAASRSLVSLPNNKKLLGDSVTQTSTV
eukprot:1157576-Pelagomonas_calceolata.AAC.1